MEVWNNTAVVLPLSAEANGYSLSVTMYVGNKPFIYLFVVGIN